MFDLMSDAGRTLPGADPHREHQPIRTNDSEMQREQIVAV
ncbi:hypothetical protein CAter282_1872 [Collimonas arenae]|uniref:Uncharacterized protein n=1 Tax=Collimonas arenae TaxID=279058 RepID=A0A127QHX2_9BURK|nr:hypothetical protein CAter10_2021 [Collimonas arenae]AMP09643.1 hypothetical protein CAter282_1872 [Collimonas arenae]